MKHTITVQVINKAAGIPSPEDGIFMLFIRAVAHAGTFLLETPYLLSSLADLEALGVDAAYDAANNVAVHQQVSEFYLEAGSGALLWIVGVSTATVYTNYVTTAPFFAHVQSTITNDPTQRAKMLGFCYDVPQNLQQAADFPADVPTAMTAINAALEILFSQGFQLSAILDGYNMSSNVNPLTIGTQATKAAPSVSLCITSTRGNGISQVGLALGRFSRISIGHGLGAVVDGPRNVPTAFLTNGIEVDAADVLIAADSYLVVGGPITYNGATYNAGQSFVAINGQNNYTVPAGSAGYCVLNSTPVQTLQQPQIDALGEKQFLFLRTWFNRAGFFWNDGATCDDPTDTLSSQEYNRTANNLSASALDFLIGKIGSNYPLNVATGAISQTVLNSWQSDYYTKYIKPLSTQGSGDITDGSLLLAAPDFLATKNVNFKLKIVPTVIMGSADGTVEFDATL